MDNHIFTELKREGARLGGVFVISRLRYVRYLLMCGWQHERGFGHSAQIMTSTKMQTHGIWNRTTIMHITNLIAQVMLVDSAESRPFLKGSKLLLNYTYFIHLYYFIHFY